MDVAEEMRLQIIVEEVPLDEATGGIFEEKFEFAEELEYEGEV